MAHLWCPHWRPLPEMEEGIPSLPLFLLASSCSCSCLFLLAPPFCLSPAKCGLIPGLMELGQVSPWANRAWPCHGQCNFQSLLATSTYDMATPSLMSSATLSSTTSKLNHCAWFWGLSTSSCYPTLNNPQNWAVVLDFGNMSTSPGYHIFDSLQNWGAMLDFRVVDLAWLPHPQQPLILSCHTWFWTLLTWPSYHTFAAPKIELLHSISGGCQSGLATTPLTTPKMEQSCSIWGGLSTSSGYHTPDNPQNGAVALNFRDYQPLLATTSSTTPIMLNFRGIQTCLAFTTTDNSSNLSHCA